MHDTQWQQQQLVFQLKMDLLNNMTIGTDHFPKMIVETMHLLTNYKALSIGRKKFRLHAFQTSEVFQTTVSSLSLYQWVLNVLSICTTKHNLNFDTFYLMIYPYWPPQNPNIIEKLRLSAFQWYQGLGVLDRVFLTNKRWHKMVEVVTFWSLTVQIIFSPFSWLGNPVTIPMNFSTWAENGQNCYLPWWVVTCFVFSCDEMGFLVLSDELRLHIIHNYIIMYIRNWLRMLGKQNVWILNILSIHLPDEEIGKKNFRPIKLWLDLWNFGPLLTECIQAQTFS